MLWNVSEAVSYLQSHAQPHSIGHCAQYVREAVEAGGVKLLRHNSAKDYGSSLIIIGFQEVPTGAGYFHRAGDVGIVQPIDGHPHGHMAMFDGRYWISDFIQMHGLYPGRGYRTAKPDYAIYRFPNLWAGPDAGQQSGGQS